MFAIVVLSERDMIIDLFGSPASIESVDKFDYVAETDSIDLAVTSLFSTADYLREDAWRLAREGSFLWGNEMWDGVEREPWGPSFALTVNGMSWSCAPETMRQVAQTRITSAEWHAACGQS